VTSVTTPTGSDAPAARYGMTIPFTGVPLHSHREWFDELVDLGYTDAWSAESDGVDGFTPLALAAAWTPALQLGIAIAPAYTRGPALLAQTVAGLADAAPGRFAVGLGASSDVIVERWNGLSYDRPYQRVRDTVRFLRAALAGEKVTEAYETFSVQGFRLDPAPEVPPALGLAALRPGMLRLAAAEAGLAITNWLAPKDVPAVRGAAGPDCELVGRIFVCPTADAGAARFIGKRMIAAYLTVPVYAAFQQWLGRGDIIEPMLTAWNSGDRKGAVEAIPDALVDELVIHGPAEQCRDRVAEYQAAGLDTPVIAITPVPGLDLADAVRKLAPA